MDLVNLSEEPLSRLHSWIPHDLTAEKVYSYQMLVLESRAASLAIMVASYAFAIRHCLCAKVKRRRRIR